MSSKLTMRISESLVAGGPPGTAAEPEIANEPDKLKPGPVAFPRG